MTGHWTHCNNGMSKYLLFHIFIASSHFVSACSVRTPSMSLTRWRTWLPMTWSLQKPSVKLSKPRSNHRKCSGFITTHRPCAFLLQVVPKVLSHFLNLQNLNVVTKPLVLPAPAHLIHNILLLILNMVLLLFPHLVILHLIILPLVPLPPVLLLFLFVTHLLISCLLIVLSHVNHTLVILLLIILLPIILLLIILPLVALLLVILLLIVLPLIALLPVVLLLIILPLITLQLVILVAPSPIVMHCLLKPMVAMAGNMYVIVILIVLALILACFLGLSTL